MVKKKTKSSHQHQSLTKQEKETLANKKHLFNIYKDLYVSDKRFQFDLTTVSDTELDVAIGKLAKWGNRLTNSNFKNHMPHIVSMYDLQAEEFLQKLYEDGIKITLIDDLGVPLREKSSDLRALEYFAIQPKQHVQRYTFIGSEIKGHGGADIIREFGQSLSDDVDRLFNEAQRATPEAIGLQNDVLAFITQCRKQYRLSKTDSELFDKLQHKLEGVTGKKVGKPESPYLQMLKLVYEYREQAAAKAALEQIEQRLKNQFLAAYPQHQDEWSRLVAIAKVTKLEKELRAQFNVLVKNDQLTPALQNLQRTKDFIIYNVKHTPKIQEAQINAYLHELRGIQATLKQQKVTAPESLVEHELVGKLKQLQQLIESGLDTLVHSNKLSAAEKEQFDKLSGQIYTILTLPRDVTPDELKVRVKKVTAAKIFIDKWLPEIAHRQNGTTTQLFTVTRSIRTASQPAEQVDELAQLNSLKQYLEASFAKLSESEVLTEKEKTSLEKLQTQVAPNFEVSESVTEEELHLKVKNLAAAKNLVEQVSRLALGRKSKGGLFASKSEKTDDEVPHSKRNDRAP